MNKKLHQSKEGELLTASQSEIPGMPGMPKIKPIPNQNPSEPDLNDPSEIEALRKKDPRLILEYAADKVDIETLIEIIQKFPRTTNSLLRKHKNKKLAKALFPARGVLDSRIKKSIGKALAAGV